MCGIRTYHKSNSRHHNFVGIKLKAVSSDFDFDTDNSDDLAEESDEI